MTKIKYCIWDVGKTCYDYSLAPLDKMFREKTSDIVAYEKSGGIFRYDYDSYMKGDVTYNEFCKDLCKKYGVNPSDEMSIRINKALREGVGEYYKETKKAMSDMKKSGVKNGILSNALPALSDTGKFDGLVDSKYVFPSYSIGFLKPDPNIFKYLQTVLDCDYSEILFIDDKGKNTKAAAELGIKTVTYDRKTINKEISKYLPKPANLSIIKGKSGLR